METCTICHGDRVVIDEHVYRCLACAGEGTAPDCRALCGQTADASEGAGEYCPKCAGKWLDCPAHTGDECRVCAGDGVVAVEHRCVECNGHGEVCGDCASPLLPVPLVPPRYQAPLAHPGCDPETENVSCPKCLGAGGSVSEAFARYINARFDVTIARIVLCAAADNAGADRITSIANEPRACMLRERQAAEDVISTGGTSETIVSGSCIAAAIELGSAGTTAITALCKRMAKAESERRKEVRS